MYFIESSSYRSPSKPVPQTELSLFVCAFSKRLIQFLGILSSLFVGLAQLSATAVAQIDSHHEFHYLRVQDGLSEPRVNCVLRDRTGYVWFGTADGLNRFDGQEVVVFRPKTLDTDASYIVTSIYEDADGFLWLGETDTAFSKFDPTKGIFLKHYVYKPGNPSDLPYKTHLSIIGRSDGTLWIGTGWQGVLQFDPRRETFTSFPLHEPAKEQRNRNAVNAIYSSELDSDIIWVGTESSGLIRLNSSTGEVRRFQDDSRETHSVVVPSGVAFIGKGPQSILWVGGENGQLYRFDSNTQRFLSVHHFANGVDTAIPEIGPIIGAIADQEGKIWVASQNAGLAEFRPGEGFRNWQQHDPQNSKSLSNNLITQLYCDSSGVIWVATKRDGVNFFDPGASWIRHDTLRDENGKYSNPTFVQCFLQDEENPDIVWLGSGAGLTRWNRTLNQFKYYQRPRGNGLGANSNAIRCFHTRRKGGFWIGTGVGLSRYDPDADRMIEIELPQVDSGEIDNLARCSIRAVHEDQHGEVWIGALPSIGRFPGLLRFNPESGNVRTYRHDSVDRQSIGPGLVTRIHEDRHGRLWFSSHMGGRGISRFDRQTGKFTRYQHDPSDPHSIRDDAVTAFHEDRKLDVLWIGTKSGLDRLAVGPKATLIKFEHISIGDSNENIIGIEQDNDNNLWLASDRGLRRTTNRNSAIVNTTVVASNMAKRFQLLNDCYYRLDAGEILIGSQTGFFEIQPDRFHTGEPPPVVFTQVRLRGRSGKAPEELKVSSQESIISYEQNNALDIKFAALDYTNPSQNRYSYRLDGFDDSWSEVSNNHSVTYPYLPAGEYTFRVKASNSKGTWNEKGALLSIKVTPPWWTTWWIRLLIVVLPASLVIGLVFYRSILLRDRNRLLELSEQRYRNLLANTSEQLWCIEPDEPIWLGLSEMEQVELIFRARVIEANEAFAKAYNSTLKVVVGNWRVEDFLPRDFPTSISFLLEAVRCRFQMDGVETIERTVDGKTKIFTNNFFGTVKNGYVSRIWGMCRDVTEMREVERQNRIRQTAMDSTRDGFLIADATLTDFPIIYANQQFTELTGYSEDDVIGKNCRFLQGPETDPVTVQQIRESLRQKTFFEGEILNYRKDGEPFWNFLRISPVVNEKEELTHFVAIQTDVTDRIKTSAVIGQQQRELAHVARFATLGEFAATMAHELSQPLAAILRNSEAAHRMLKYGNPDMGELQQIFADILRDDRRAGRVLERIRAHLQKREQPQSAINLNDIIVDCMAMLKGELVTHDLHVQLKLMPDLPGVMGDSVELQQVVINLVLNAEVALKEELAQKELVIATDLDEHGNVRFSISDTGPGIHERDLERVFTPFHSTKKNGMGMGLAINRTIIHAHNGKIWAESRTTRGAQFVFILPQYVEHSEKGDV